MTDEIVPYKQQDITKLLHLIKLLHRGCSIQMGQPRDNLYARFYWSGDEGAWKAEVKIYEPFRGPTRRKHFVSDDFDKVFAWFLEHYPIG